MHYTDCIAIRMYRVLSICLRFKYIQYYHSVYIDIYYKSKRTHNKLF